MSYYKYSHLVCRLVLGRYRFLKSVSVFGIFFGFFKSRFGFSVLFIYLRIYMLAHS